MIPNANVDLRTLVVNDIPTMWFTKLEAELEVLVESILERVDVPISWKSVEHMISILSFAKLQTRLAVLETLDASINFKIDTTSKLTLVANLGIAGSIDYLRQLGRARPIPFIPRLLLQSIKSEDFVELPKSLPRFAANVGAVTLDDVKLMSEVDRSRVDTELERVARIAVNTFDMQLPLVSTEQQRLILDEASVRTRNAITRALSFDPLSASSTSRLMKIRNLGITSLIDYLRQVDRYEISPLRTGYMQQETPTAGERRLNMPLSLHEDVVNVSLAVSFMLMLSKIVPRYRSIVIKRAFMEGAVPTLQELAEPLGITRERVRQIEEKRTRQIANLLMLPQHDALRIAIENARQRLGRAATLAPAISAMYEIMEVPDGLFLPDEVLRYALWFAGFKERDERWIYSPTRSALLAEVNARLILEVARESSPENAIRAVATVLEIPERLISEMLEETDVTILQNHLIKRSQNMNGRVEAVFRVNRKLLTANEILQALKEDDSRRGYIENILGSDSRFVRATLTQFGLAEWGHERYTSIADALGQMIEKSGGFVSLAAAIRVIAQKYGVSAHSIRTYAHANPFEVDEYGNVRRRLVAASEKVDAKPPQVVKQLFRINGVWHYRIKITVDTLRGSGLPLTMPVAVILGLRLGSIVKREYQKQEVTFRWTSAQPAISSVRRLVEENGLGVGDFLFLGLSVNVDSPVLSIKAVDIYRRIGLERLALMCGVADYESDRLLERIGYALGLSESSISCASLRAALIERKDDEAAKLVPPDRTHILDDPFDDLAAMLE